MVIAATYIGLSLVVGILGIRRKFGFWGYFFCSLALSPCVGAIVLLGSDRRPKQARVKPKP